LRSATRLWPVGGGGSGRKKECWALWGGGVGFGQGEGKKVGFSEFARGTGEIIRYQKTGRKGRGRHSRAEGSIEHLGKRAPGCLLMELPYSAGWGLARGGTFSYDNLLGKGKDLQLCTLTPQSLKGGQRMGERFWQSLKGVLKAGGTK